MTSPSPPLPPSPPLSLTTPRPPLHRSGDIKICGRGWRCRGGSNVLVDSCQRVCGQGRGRGSAERAGCGHASSVGTQLLSSVVRSSAKGRKGYAKSIAVGGILRRRIRRTAHRHVAMAVSRMLVVRSRLSEGRSGVLSDAVSDMIIHQPGRAPAYLLGPRPVSMAGGRAATWQPVQGLIASHQRGRAGIAATS